MDRMKLFLSLYRLIPAYLLIITSNAKHAILEDAEFWNKINNKTKYSQFVQLGLLLYEYKEFRNLVSNRFHKEKHKNLCRSNNYW